MAGNSNLSSYIVLIIVVVIVTKFSIGRNSVPSNPAELDRWLVRQSSETNASLPKMIDAETRLDTTKAGPGPQFTFNYSLPARAMADVDLAALKQYVRTKTVQAICKSSRPILKAGVTVNLVYRSKDGSLLTRVAVAPADC